MVVLADLQGVVATFRVGRHHHHGPFYEGRGLTRALTHTAPTMLWALSCLSFAGLGSFATEGFRPPARFKGGDGGGGKAQLVTTSLSVTKKLNS